MAQNRLRQCVNQTIDSLRQRVHVVEHFEFVVGAQASGRALFEAIRMPSYAFALQRLHRLADFAAAATEELPQSGGVEAAGGGPRNVVEFQLAAAVRILVARRIEHDPAVGGVEFARRLYRQQRAISDPRRVGADCRWRRFGFGAASSSFGFDGFSSASANTSCLLFVLAAHARCPSVPRLISEFVVVVFVN